MVSNVPICFNIDMLINSQETWQQHHHYAPMSHFLFLSVLEPLSWFPELDRVDENAVVVFINFI